MKKHNETIEWVPEIDGLPDDERDVLLYRPDDDIDPVVLGFRRDDRWWHASVTPAEGVTHWAYLPRWPR